MINIERALKDSRLMLAMTGVTPQEFQNLIPAFSQAWLEEKRKQHRKDSKERKLGGGRIGFLKTLESKLFFILFYYKCYPTYDVLSFVYACNRSNACRRQFRLSNVIEKTLGKKLTLPERRMKKLRISSKLFPKLERCSSTAPSDPSKDRRTKKDRRPTIPARKRNIPAKIWLSPKKTSASDF